jgi:non-ribosomal peptide synthase protein (TIGR01720 family)
MAYTTSGGEAVETAIRAARTITGRDKVAYFTDDIHGRSDVVLGRAVEVRGEPRTVPMVAGVPQNVVDDALVLAYGTERALELIRARADELALVLVEPVRTRNPDLQPLEFLRELRRMADESGFLLVFDEIVTGFRAHIGGVQALFGIRADITTYGKVLGGGLPIGVVAGASNYIDVIDGGPWSFGDDSFPEADITASGGTFIKHPLTLAAAKAVLTHLGERGASLQADLNMRTAAAVTAINAAYEHEGLALHVEHFSSFFRPSFLASTRFAGLFQYYLRERGVHTNPPSPSFLSTAHSEADIEAVVSAYVEAGRAMARDGLLEATRPLGTAAAELVEPTKPAPAVHAIPVLPNVARFLVERNTPDPDHWNLGVLLRPEHPLDPDLTREVVRVLVERHDALRLRFYPVSTGWGSSIAPIDEPMPISSFDLSDLSGEAQRASLEQHAGEIQASLDLERGPLFRVALFDLGADEQRLLVIVHHFAMDAFSWRPFWEDFETIYQQLERDDHPNPSPRSTSFEEWAHALKRRADSQDLRSEVPAWLDLPWDRIRAIPIDRDGHIGVNTNASARQVALDFTIDETSAMLQQTPGIVHKTDLLMTALGEVIADWTGSDTALFDMMGHGRDEDSFEDADLFGTVGFFISYTPMVLSLPSRQGASSVLSDQIQPILRRGLGFDLLRYMTSDAVLRQRFNSLPRAQILFNHLGKRDEVDAAPRGSMFSTARESIGLTHSPKGIRYYPLAISSEIWRDQLRLKFVYSENLHDRSTIETLAERFRDRLITHVTALSPAGSIAE